MLKYVISYNAEDEAIARRLYDFMVRQFGNKAVQFGVGSLGNIDQIHNAIPRIDTLIVLVGSEWEENPALQTPSSPAYSALTTAIATNRRIMPLMVNGRTMPDDDTLPPELRVVTKRQGMPISHNTFTDVAQQIAYILMQSVVAPVNYQEEDTIMFGIQGHPPHPGSNPKIELTSVPMPAQVTNTMRQVHRQLPPLALVSGVSGLLFAIAWFLTAAFDSSFMSALANTGLLALGYYSLGYIINLDIPDTNARSIYLLTGGLSVLNFIYHIIDQRSVILLLVYMLAYAGIVAYTFSSYNKFIPPTTAIDRHMTITLFMAAIPLAALPIVLGAFRITADLTASQGDFNFHMLIFGAIQGVLLGVLLYSTLKEAARDEIRGYMAPPPLRETDTVI